MRDKPIIFSAPMVRALHDGRKTQTRRVLKPQPRYRDDVPTKLVWQFRKDIGIFNMDDDSFRRHAPALCGYRPGDRLWVREAHAIVGSVDPGWVLYQASGYAQECARHGFDTFPDESAVRWRPSIHMPRWASRLTLLVTDARVQRLQEISEEDAEAEGWPAPEARAKDGIAEIRDAYPIGWFAHLWDSIHGPGAWDENPWVSAVTFTTHPRNIDAMEPGHA